MQVFGSTPGLCGSIAAPMKLSGKSLRDAEDELVADRGPGRTHREVADVMGHEAGARRKDREVRAALLHELELVRLDRLPKLVVADLEFRSLGRVRGILDAGDLPVAPCLERLGSGRVVAVAIDDHVPASDRFTPAPYHSVVSCRRFPPRPRRRSRAPAAAGSADSAGDARGKYGHRLNLRWEPVSWAI